MRRLTGRLSPATYFICVACLLVVGANPSVADEGWQKQQRQNSTNLVIHCQTELYFALARNDFGRRQALMNWRSRRTRKSWSPRATN
jgi:hypothetical protein